MRRALTLLIVEHLPDNVAGAEAEVARVGVRGTRLPHERHQHEYKSEEEPGRPERCLDEGPNKSGNAKRVRRVNILA